MKVNCIEDKETLSTGAVIITLENGAQIHILELDEGTLKVENITTGKEMGIAVIPEGVGVFTMIPEAR